MQKKQTIENSGNDLESDDFKKQFQVLYFYVSILFY